MPKFDVNRECPVSPTSIRPWLSGAYSVPRSCGSAVVFGHEKARWLSAAPREARPTQNYKHVGEAVALQGIHEKGAKISSVFCNESNDL